MSRSRATRLWRSSIAGTSASSSATSSVRSERVPKDRRLQSGGKAIYMLSGILRCGICDSHFVMDSKTHYRCGKALDGKGCKNTIRVPRAVAEWVILHKVRDGLLAPDMIEDMAKEMRSYYYQRMAGLRAKRTKVPAEVEELNKRIARLQERLKSGDPDLSGGRPAAQYRQQITKGLQGHLEKAGRARIGVRRLLGDSIKLSCRPPKAADTW